jgi:TPP-dependent pyruvate/acetoin dehydrogenase alpha subunit
MTKKKQPANDTPSNVATLTQCYAQMLRIRRVEERLSKRFNDPLLYSAT